jgi:hypothetical protein
MIQRGWFLVKSNLLPSKLSQDGSVVRNNYESIISSTKYSLVFRMNHLGHTFPQVPMFLQ